MTKKILLLALCSLLLALSFPAGAQQQGKVFKIGWFGTRSASAPAPVLALFRRELRALGYVEGKNIAIEYRSAENKPDRLPALADELVRLKVDVLFAPSTNEALVAKNATKTIPIVFVGSGDPVAAGLVDSLARPGGNITGFTRMGTVLVGKRLELLKETIPKLSRVALMWNPQDPGSRQEWKESQLPARELGLQLHSMEVSSADKIDSAFNETAKAGSGALAAASSPLFTTNQKRIADLAKKYQLPAIHSRGDQVDSGGLMSYGADQAESYKRAASMVDKILKGTKPADLPVEQPTKFELVINLKTAKQIGLTIPPNVLARADKVIR
ncbi:MAG: ABC transporter substrate-binding protein [Deltaproteobacteria bacterium]|nr:MAG: ABC transporter substrate-binding protein [Deltaproteobacteria bacterium]